MHLKNFFLLSVLLTTGVVGPFLADASTSISAHESNVVYPRFSDDAISGKTELEPRYFSESSQLRKLHRGDHKRDLEERYHRESSNRRKYNRAGDKRDLVERYHRESSNRRKYNRAGDKRDLAERYYRESSRRRKFNRGDNDN
ncbi:2933_t:CDS:1 [Funneliformis caledonium]|uniref:2933_t:CDS:1 n=1 Tax=Funneliformis caledonium TaxID=1117310 RepID=A0A9N9ATA0_9GLOM|nr:2933_t:CDS:1 [Funneliformis caledonium]